MKEGKSFLEITNDLKKGKIYKTSEESPGSFYVSYKFGHYCFSAFLINNSINHTMAVKFKTIEEIEEGGPWVLTEIWVKYEEGK